MTIPTHPQLRPLELTPAGPEDELQFVLRDPEGFGKPLVIPYGAALVALLMDGQRSLSEIQSAFEEQTGSQAPLAGIEEIVRRLDDGYLLAGSRFDRYREEQIHNYLSDPVRSPTHAGQAYAQEPAELRKQLAELFAQDGAPGDVNLDDLDPAESSCGCDCGNSPGGESKADRWMRGLISPHIDPQRGGPAFAWAYTHVDQRSDADLFVIFGTAHQPMEQPFCVSRKDFHTPLGTVRTDQQFIDRLAEQLGSSVAGRQIDLSADEPCPDGAAHRFEHSIEFQTLFLQYVLGERRPFRIVPVLTGSFDRFIAEGTNPDDSPEIQAFVAAVRAAADRHAGKVCYISGADLGHVGRQFGDEWVVDEDRVNEQSEDDRKLLELACHGDAAGLFSHVAEQNDSRRICGLSPIYTMLQVMGPTHGTLLKYDGAVDDERTSCVTFASVAYYR